MANIDSITYRFSLFENSIIYLTGVILLYLSASFLVPLVAAFLMGEDIMLFLIPTLVCLLIALPLVFLFKTSPTIRPVEGLFLVSITWLFAMAVGAIPFVLAGMGIVDACFESMSGFTTTGSTIMTDIESWPSSLLLWRSMIQWIGGAGIITVFITILPILGIGGRALFRNEFPGMEVQNFTFRVQEAAKEFHAIYLVLSGCLLALVLLMGESLFDALCIMFSTMSTGGFSPHSESIAYFSPIIQWIVIIFMFLAATNFYLHYRAIYRHELRAYKSSAEFRGFALVCLIATVFTFFIVGAQMSGLSQIREGEEVLRSSAFQIVSAITSTGYAIEDYNAWPAVVQMLILVIMLIGANSGSTAGGLKMGRAIIGLKFIYQGLMRQIHPRAVLSLKIDGKTINDDAVSVAMATILLYFATLVVASFILLAIGNPPLESFTSVAACISNHGPGMGAVGPYGNFAWMDPLSKAVLIFTMWAGRLELLTVFVLLTPDFWKELRRYAHRNQGTRLKKS
ncbi:MAG: trk/ktr system potassium uptake protein [Candidatus Methanomethylophilaceae archaeon]|nr:trk/ktr system potassium uptake protein [Candidatus Methanomethylophilaceae archaeon]MDI3542200.1 trk/ktr system potassium uptake protein [Candidatus Methanomethylophilaceae archaeon]